MGSEYAIQAVANGAVELYYNDIKLSILQVAE